ncbi:MAG: hypothetical protein CL693_08490 [Cellvibrionaceae bacterium]|nr:hypothetical protein [Cellvibrionaceae bacterium]|tara:strand:+ start:25534 stop:25932 length:399 start_codon:yes stop_codon:yes gene_type:complete
MELAWGAMVVVAFLVSGVYLKAITDPATELDLARMMYRSNHIYLLMSGLAVILWAQRKRTTSIGVVVSLLRYLAGLSIVIAPLIFVVAFIVEAGVIDSQRLWTFYGVIVLFAGVMATLLVSMVEELIAYYQR